MEYQRREFLEEAIQKLSEQDRHHLLFDMLGVEHINAKLGECIIQQRKLGIVCRECESIARKLGIL